MTDLAARISRLGTESAFEVLARVKALEDQGQDIINLGIGQPDFKTPDHIVEAATKALRDGHHGYTPAAGIAELRQAVSAHIAKHRGVAVDPGDAVRRRIVQPPVTARHHEGTSGVGAEGG